MLTKLVGFFDFMPGYKAKVGAVVFVVGYALQLAGVDVVYVEPLKAFAEALMVFGLAMKEARSRIKK